MQAYKGIKAILAASLYSHINPKTGTNPFFQAMGYVPGNRLQDTAVGPAPPGAAEQEEVLASAHIHLPKVLELMQDSAEVQVSWQQAGGCWQPCMCINSSQCNLADLCFPS